MFSKIIIGELEMPTINNNQPAVSFGGIVFKNQSDWIRHGKSFVDAICENNDLKFFVKENPDKNVVFSVKTIKKVNKTPVLEFYYQVKEKGIKGFLKGIFQKSQNIGNAAIGRSQDCVLMKDASRICYQDLVTFGQPKHPQLGYEHNQVIKKIITPEFFRFGTYKDEVKNKIDILTRSK